MKEYTFATVLTQQKRIIDAFLLYIFYKCKESTKLLML